MVRDDELDRRSARVGDGPDAVGPGGAEDLRKLLETLKGQVSITRVELLEPGQALGRAQLLNAHVAQQLIHGLGVDIAEPEVREELPARKPLPIDLAKEELLDVDVG